MFAEDSLVSATMLALRAARSGLSEPELQVVSIARLNVTLAKEILSISAPTWSRLSFSYHELVMARSGLLCVRRKQIQDAVEKRYLEMTPCILD